jgi:hypothetical protein
MSIVHHSSSISEPDNLRGYSSYVDMFKKTFLKLSDKYKNELEYWTQYHISCGHSPDKARGFAEGSIWGGELAHAFKCLTVKQEYKTEIIVNLYEDTNKIVHDLTARFKEIKVQIIKAKRELPIAQGIFGDVTDYIRNDNGTKVKNPFNLWNRILESYKAWLNNGKKLDMNLVIDIKNRNGKVGDEVAAYNRVQEEIKMAIEFIRRAENGTFPYDEDGKWKVDLKAIKL